MASMPLPTVDIHDARTFQKFEALLCSEAAYLDYIQQLRWRDGFIGTRCRTIGTPWETTRGELRCRACEAELAVTVGAISQDIHKPRRLWFAALWFITSRENGVRVLGLQRVLGLGSYRTAWTWQQTLRGAMVRPVRDSLAGEVEVDEAHVNDGQLGVCGRQTAAKAFAALAVEKDRRGFGRARMRPIHEISANSLRPLVRGVIELGGNDQDRRLARRLRPDGRRLTPSDLRDQRQPRHTCLIVARPEICVVVQALARGNPQRPNAVPASRVLPRRICPLFQWQQLQGSRRTLESARPAGRRHRSCAMPRNRRRVTTALTSPTRGDYGHKMHRDFLGHQG